MKFANYTQFYRDREQHGIEYAAEHAAKLGLDGVEYFVSAPSPIYASAKDEKAVLDRYGLDVVCYSVGVQLFVNDQKTVEEQMLREIEAAAILGASYFHHTLCPSYVIDAVPSSYEEVFKRIVDVAERIARACNQHGITCLYEPQGMYFNGVEGLEKMVCEIQRRGCKVGVCGDFGNSLFVDVDPRRIFDRFCKDICHVHVKDYLVTDQPIPDKTAYRSASGKYIHDTLIGQGVVDFAHGFEALRRAGYDGVISLEAEGSDEELLSALRFLKQLI